VSLTQGGDELDLLRKLRRRGRVVYDHANPTYTSGRRLTRGLVYNLFVTLFVHYLLAYSLNRLFRRRILGSAPAYRDNIRRPARYLRTAAAVSAAAVVLLAPAPRDYLVRTSHAVVDYVTVRWDRDAPR
jgi:formate hydrogenlyase subunit 3/multisubunit Na+/H+ antiporter MnhD subunit